MKIRRVVRDSVFAALDMADKLAGRGHHLNPPRRLMNGGTDSIFRNDFNAIGRRLFRTMVELGDVKRTDRVLDVGCSVGRLAIEFTEYLTTGTYDGFDVEQPAIAFCQRVITPRHPNFRFLHADVQNSHYTPGRGTCPEDYRFPYEDGVFDFALLTSVFTHMQPSGVLNYLREISRVLSPGGRVFATFFLLDEAAGVAIQDKQAALTFRHPVGVARVEKQSDPDHAVAYPAEFIFGALDDSGLAVKSLYKGSWSGIESTTGFQDTIVAVRPVIATNDQ